MAKYKLSKAIQTSAVYGLVDIGAEIADGSLKTTYPMLAQPFTNITDISRVVAVLLPTINKSVLKNKSIAHVEDTVQAAAIPLLEKSVYKAIRAWVPTLNLPVIEGRNERFQLRARGYAGAGAIPVGIQPDAPTTSGNVF